MNETKKINKRFTGEIVTIIDLEPNHEDDIPDEPVGNAIKIIADLISSCC